ncbi:uncharacterized protein LODBEIA_P27110 [Lodderomyces beijingensis]|uniref:Protein SIP5 n=1 Tax=Lodderomyces beijingensis TaxID=1775926 RepID=A0ABP0ZK07_9ASCO
MGNVPAKESRSRSNSAVSTIHAGSSPNTYNTSTASSSNRGGAAGGGGSRQRRHTNSAATSGQASNSKSTPSSSDLRKRKRQEEKEQKQYYHYSQLVVRPEENVDGGYLAPFGTYKSNLDYDVDIVRSLIVNRQISPFFTPLQDFDESWTNEELAILLSQLPLHAFEEPTGLNDDENEEDDLDNHKIHKSSNYYKRQEEKAKLKSLIIKMKEIQKDEENKYLEYKKRGHSQCPSKDLSLKLYRHPSECPICFLYYPSHLNVSRCCLQPICTECFVQIKRLDPHPPHDDPSNQQAGEQPHSLISEPASCPYCAMPDFGVTYEPPIDIHTGIGGIAPGDYKTVSAIAEDESASAITDGDGDGDEDSTGGSPSPSSKVPKGNFDSPTSPPPASSMVSKVLKKKAIKRRSSVAATAPGVTTIDIIRPDWEVNLNSARHKLARKAAAATAIHASNLIIEGNTNNSRARSSTVGSNSGYAAVEQRMIEEAMRLSLLDEEERRRKADRGS